MLAVAWQQQQPAWIRGASLPWGPAVAGFRFQGTGQLFPLRGQYKLGLDTAAVALC